MRLTPPRAVAAYPLLWRQLTSTADMSPNVPAVDPIPLCVRCLTHGDEIRAPRLRG